MATSKNKKTSILDILKNDVSQQKSIILVTTNDTTMTVDAKSNFDLRVKSNLAGIKVQVVKNSLIEKSFSGAKGLRGQTYIAYLNNKEDSNEVIVPKLFVKMIDKDFKNQFSVVGAIINGEFVNSAEAIKYSNIPTKDESLGMVAGAVNQIASGLARAIKEISEKTTQE